MTPDANLRLTNLQQFLRETFLLKVSAQFYQVTLSTPTIYLVILLTVCHTILSMFVRRI